MKVFCTSRHLCLRHGLRCPDSTHLRLHAGGGLFLLLGTYTETSISHWAAVDTRRCALYNGDGRLHLFDPVADAGTQEQARAFLRDAKLRDVREIYELRLLRSPPTVQPQSQNSCPPPSDVKRGKTRRGKRGGRRARPGAGASESCVSFAFECKSTGS